MSQNANSKFTHQKMILLKFKFMKKFNIKFVMITININYVMKKQIFNNDNNEKFNEKIF